MSAIEQSLPTLLMFLRAATPEKRIEYWESFLACYYRAEMVAYYRKHYRKTKHQHLCLKPKHQPNQPLIRL